jgi:hypothetical protein
MRNPISIEAFAEFCESKPVGEEYEYGNFANCAVAQYCRTLGIEYSVAALPRVVNNGFEKPVGFWHSDLVFQAHCQIDYLNDYVEEGCRFESCDGDAVEIELSDGSYTTIYLGPIKQLVAAMERLPKPEDIAPAPTA